MAASAMATFEPGPTAVTYIGLPIGSGGAHGLGRLGLREAYGRATAFVNVCTELVAPREQRFRFQQVPELPDLPVWEQHFREQFGGGDDPKVDVPDDQVEAALAFLESVEPQPANRWGLAPLWFTTAWKIRLLDPRTREPYPGQDPARYAGVEYEWGVPLGESNVRLNLSNRASLALEICLPDVDDEQLREVISELQAHAPFRFSSKQWRRWTPTKTGSYRSRKIDPGA
jgi:hypothetical protein